MTTGTGASPILSPSLASCRLSPISSEFESETVSAHTITWLFVVGLNLFPFFPPLLVSRRVWSEDVGKVTVILQGATKGLTAFTMCSRCIVQYHCGVFSHSYWFPVKLYTQWLHIRGSGGAEALTFYLTLFLSFYFQQFLAYLGFYLPFFSIQWFPSFSCDQTGIFKIQKLDQSPESLGCPDHTSTGI